MDYNKEQLIAGIEYLDDPRFSSIIRPLLMRLINTCIEILCKSENNGDINRGKIQAYKHILNLKRELENQLTQRRRSH